MNKKNILISDANHGGLVLLEEYSKYTHNNLFFYDIYKKLTSTEKRSLSSIYKVTFLSLDEILEDEDSFIKINPVHMPPVIKTDYTHHQFVSYLLNKMDTDFKLIQITGVKGKTTVTTLLKSVFMEYNILALTSEELTYNDKTLKEHLSITPASIITAINVAKEENLLDKIDYVICEVSLGVIPYAYINVLTNILEDYPIAKSSSNASIAKESVFTSEHTICDYDAYQNYYKKYDNVMTLSLDNEHADIYANSIDYDIDKTRFVINYFDEKYEISHFALSDFYINNLLFAISVGLVANIPVSTIISNISKNDGVRGRNSVRKINDVTLIEDINPGLNTTSIKKCVDNLARYCDDYMIILGGDYGITCEEIDEKRLSEYINTINTSQIILTGQLGKSLTEQTDSNILFISKLDYAIKYCIEKKDKKLIQIIYRNRYNSKIEH